ncbi:MAG TPA: DinB family protein [Pyrinomonadaceae bacterium]|jgi:hypothetical protein|nr:DinB family protein [Pyrinomonadaceae bacterium]
MNALKFDIERACEVLGRTPDTLAVMLGGLAEDWTQSSGQQDSWAPHDVIGHLIHGEKTDWIPRAELILAQGETRTFVPFDRFAQFSDSKEKTLAELLDEFGTVRRENLAKLRSWNLTDEMQELRGMHPELGVVTLAQLLATWVVHDLNHISQISRSMARKYADNVGPWKEYLSILN